MCGCSANYAPLRGELVRGPDLPVVAEAGSGLPRVVEEPLLQACVDRASADQKAVWGSDFSFLRFDREGLRVSQVAQGRRSAARLDGQGGWWGVNDDGAREYRAVRFSCLLNRSGAVFAMVTAGRD